MARIRFSHTPPGHSRRHYINSDDVDVLLDRLPEQVWSRLRAVHFNDQSMGVRRLGYVTRARREIAICALPEGVSLSRFLSQRSPRLFGALRGQQWPELAVRRFLLYDVFLHELGHLQIVDPKAPSVRRRFAGETKAGHFADAWRKRLWREPLDHPDPAHRPPMASELDTLDSILSECVEAKPLGFDPT